MSSTETDASETGSADQYDATADTTSFFVGSPLGSRSYVRLAINSTEQSSDATGNDKADGEKKTTKDSDGFSLLYVRVFSSSQRLILSYTSSESEFAKQEIDGKKRLDELGYLSAKYTLNGEAVTPRLQDYKLNFDVSMLDSTSNQKSANVESTTYKFSISRKFDLY